ncbi:hypothetical protein BC829DRAFT_362492, partial [Chytridium lagenaria]
GIRPDEAVSWGKIRMTAEAVKAYAYASFIFLHMIAGTFAMKRAEEADANKAVWTRHGLALLRERHPLPAT